MYLRRLVQWLPRPLPWYPFGFAAAFVLVVYVSNDVSAASLPRPLAIAAMLTALPLATAGLVFRNVHAGAAVAMIGLLMLRSRDMPQAGLILGLAGLVYAIIRVLARRRGVATSARKATSVANALASILLLVILANAVANGTIIRSIADVLPAEPRTVRASGGSAAPDIYVMLLDGYPRADALRDIFGYDNTPFLDELEHRGFDVAAGSTSNYMYTAHTLSAMLQMRHLPELQAHPGEQLSYRRMINDNPVFPLLRDHGYTLEWNRAPWDDVAVETADVTCGAGQVSELEWNLLGRTVLGKAVAEFVPDSVAWDRHRAFTHAAFSCFEESAGLGQPVFSFTHVPIPHEPIVFTASGQPAKHDVGVLTIDQLDVSFERFSAAYLEQLEFLNQSVLVSLDRVLARDSDAVVVVMSDHGSATHLRDHFGDEMRLEERFKSFFASRTPGRPCLFGDRPLTANLFPTLLAEYLAEPVEALERRYYAVSAPDASDFEEQPSPSLPNLAGACS